MPPATEIAPPEKIETKPVPERGFGGGKLVNSPRRAFSE
jgi:hypothetical protein